MLKFIPWKSKEQNKRADKANKHREKTDGCQMGVGLGNVGEGEGVTKYKLVVIT